MIVDSTLFWNPVNRLFSIHQVAFEAEFDGGPRFDFLQRISIPFKRSQQHFSSFKSKFKRSQHDSIFVFGSFESWERFSFFRQTIAQKIMTFLEKLNVELTRECINWTCKTFLQKYKVFFNCILYIQQGSVFFMLQNNVGNQKVVLSICGLIAGKVGILEKKKKTSWARLISVKFQTTFNHISTKNVIWKGSMFTFNVMSDYGYGYGYGMGTTVVYGISAPPESVQNMNSSS